jgi:hypothetical protein
MSALKVDMRNLVYKLCEGREVPLLVTDMIAELLVHRDLFNINTLSRTLNAQANAIIYRDVVVDLDGTKRSVEKASLLFRTLLTSKTAARAVNSLSLAGDPLQNWRTSLGSVDKVGTHRPCMRISPISPEKRSCSTAMSLLCLP